MAIPNAHDATTQATRAIDYSQSVSMDDGHAQLCATQAVAWALLAIAAELHTSNDLASIRLQDEGLLR